MTEKNNTQLVGNYYGETITVRRREMSPEQWDWEPGAEEITLQREHGERPFLTMSIQEARNLSAAITELTEKK